VEGKIQGSRSGNHLSPLTQGVACDCKPVRGEGRGTESACQISGNENPEGLGTVGTQDPIKTTKIETPPHEETHRSRSADRVQSWTLKLLKYGGMVNAWIGHAELHRNGTKRWEKTRSNTACIV